VRLVTPALSKEGSLDITKSDWAFQNRNLYQTGSRSYVIPSPVGKELILKYQLTKDGSTPWPGQTLSLLVGGGYSGSNAAWAWSNEKIGPRFLGWFSMWAGSIDSLTDSNGIATFALKSIDESSYPPFRDSSKNWLEFEKNPDDYFMTRFGVRLNGFSDYDSPYFLQDVLNVVMVENQDPTPAPTPTRLNTLTYAFTTQVTKKPPKTIKWGKSFQVSIKTSGTGGALCEMVFQNPGWPSRQGITPFRLTAGKTTNVTVRPWARLFLSYPLKYVCIPDGWPRINSDGSISIYDKRVGGNLGNVTIVP
jgi:hypothetical protein